LAPKPETRLRTKIQRALRQKYDGIYVEHPHGSQFSSGMPDLIGCWLGTFFGLEVKVPGNNRVSKLQEEHLHRIEMAGGYSAVVRSVEEAVDVIDEIQASSQGA